MPASGWRRLRDNLEGRERVEELEVWELRLAYLVNQAGPGHHMAEALRDSCRRSTMATGGAGQAVFGARHELRSIEVLAGQRCEARAKTSPLGEQPVKLVPKAIELACCVFKLEGLLTSV